MADMHAVPWSACEWVSLEMVQGPSNMGLKHFNHVSSITEPLD